MGSLANRSECRIFDSGSSTLHEPMESVPPWMNVFRRPAVAWKIDCMRCIFEIVEGRMFIPLVYMNRLKELFRVSRLADLAEFTNALEI